MNGSESPIVVLISADVEWETSVRFYPHSQLQASPLGQWFVAPVKVGRRRLAVRFFHGGWGKIAAAASTQYVIDRWSPAVLVNLGTCGGIAGEVERGTIILAERTLVYDVFDLMSDGQAEVAHYATDLDLTWLPADESQVVQRSLLVSADRDLAPADIDRLKVNFGAVAADWESGAIAYVAARNQTPCLILRGVSDLVGPGGGEAYDGSRHVFVENAQQVMTGLLEALPEWLERMPWLEG